MKKSLITIAIAAVLGVGSLLGSTAVKTEAASVSGLQKKKDQVHNQRSSINSSINKADQKISKLKGQQANVQAEINRIGLSIDNTTTIINDETNKVIKTKTQIAKLQDEIKVIQARIQKRYNLLKERARNFQENGGTVSYLDVLLGAQSFSDFIDRAGAVTTIMQADQTILKQAEADENELVKKQAEVQTELTKLQNMLSELQDLNTQLNSQKAEQNKLLASLKVQQKQVENEKMSMQEQDQLLADQEAAIQKAIKLAQEQQAEAAREAAARAAAAREAAAKNSSSNSGSSYSGGGGGSSQSEAPPISSGYFTRPAAGVISSGFGQRWGEFHPGVDIANSGSNVPIVAAADGVVIRSYLSSSYGNCIFISHYINGQLYTTVYAHMAVRLVGDGAVVKKGQQIGIMGSTGESTGQHLHFELHRGEWNYAKTNAINPVGIVPF